MKSIYKLLFAIFLSFIFILGVEAEPTFDVQLSCPSSALTKQKIKCTVSAKAAEEDITDLNIEITTNQYITYVGDDINQNTVVTSDYVKIGTIDFETKSISGKAVVTISVDAKTENTTIPNKKKSATISVKSNVDTLKDLKVDGKTVPNFNKNIISYTINTTKSSVVISAVPTSNGAKIAGTGTKNLQCGSNVYTIIVTAENGVYRNYTVGINRTCDQKAYLKGISLSSGVLKPAFDKSITNYTVEVDKTVEKITVTGVQTSANQKVDGNVQDRNLNFGNNQIAITVSNDNGEKQVYIVNVIRKDDRTKNAYLSSLTLSSGTINFDKNTFNYETKVLYNVENIEILAVPEEETAKVTIMGNKNLNVGENTIIVKVTSEDKSEKTYTIKVTRLNEGETLGNNPNIKNIIIKGYNLKFNINKENYKLIIDKEDILNITVEMEDENATYEIIGNKDLEDGSVIKIVTKSSDGESKTYTIEIIKNSYIIYFVIFGILILIAIALPIFVYFKSVKGKKKVLDVNGYEVGKGYEEKDYSRKVISGSSINQNLQPVQPIQNTVVQNDLNQQMNMQNANLNNQNIQSGLDSELSSYNQHNSDTTCPNCGRELLGLPNECPYCRMKLR